MNTLKDIFPPYEIAVKLKEIGFDEPCIFYYSGKGKMHCLTPNRTEQNRLINIEEIDRHNANESEAPFCSAPTYEQVFKWFRNHQIESHIKEVWCKETYYEVRINDYRNEYTFKRNDFKTYEQAREQLILKLIEIYKQ